MKNYVNSKTILKFCLIINNISKVIPVWNFDLKMIKLTWAFSADELKRKNTYIFGHFWMGMSFQKGYYLE